MINQATKKVEYVNNSISLDFLLIHKFCKE